MQKHMQMLDSWVARRSAVAGFVGGPKTANVAIIRFFFAQVASARRKLPVQAAGATKKEALAGPSASQEGSRV